MNEFEFSRFYGKAKVLFKCGGMSDCFSLNVRVYPQKVFWFGRKAQKFLKIKLTKVVYIFTNFKQKMQIKFKNIQTFLKSFHKLLKKT
jgi:hypothetical protein